MRRTDFSIGSGRKICWHSSGSCWSVSQFDDDGAFVLAVLSRRHESVDRDEMLAEYERIKSTKEYKKILRQKELYFE